MQILCREASKLPALLLYTIIIFIRRKFAGTGADDQKRCSKWCVVFKSCLNHVFESKSRRSRGDQLGGRSDMQEYALLQNALEPEDL